MKRLLPLLFLAFLAHAPNRAWCAHTEGVALAIVYDTSGSMQQSVPDAQGARSPKYVIARRALVAVVNRLQAFATNAAVEGRRLEAGMFVFSGNGAREWVKFGAFDPKRVEAWTKDLPLPSAGTPLGGAIQTASRALARSSLSRKHILVITDGVNTVGADPARVWPEVRQRATQQGDALSVHFLAFDVDARVFDPMKKLGATVVGASNEKQLNEQLGFILEKKILLEDEEPTAKSK